jgi:hypothetical protein
LFSTKQGGWCRERAETAQRGFPSARDRPRHIWLLKGSSLQLTGSFAQPYSGIHSTSILSFGS